MRWWRLVAAACKAREWGRPSPPRARQGGLPGTAHTTPEQPAQPAGAWRRVTAGDGSDRPPSRAVVSTFPLRGVVDGEPGTRVANGWQRRREEPFCGTDCGSLMVSYTN
ncbi:unnamed protein product [Natator depressus]